MTCVTPLGKLFAYQFDAKDKDYWMAIFDTNHSTAKPAEAAAPVRMRAPTILQPNLPTPVVPVTTGVNAINPTVAALAGSEGRSHRASKSRSGKREGGVHTTDGGERKRKTTKTSGASSKSSSKDKESKDPKDKVKKTASRTKKHRDSTRDTLKKKHSHRSSRRVTSDETSDLNEQVTNAEKKIEEGKKSSSSSSAEEKAATPTAATTTDSATSRTRSILKVI